MLAAPAFGQRFQCVATPGRDHQIHAVGGQLCREMFADAS
jgi:hypothetical protein